MALAPNPKTRTRLLLALAQHFEDNLPPVGNGPGQRSFKIRHWRHREPDDSEWDCVSLRYVGRNLPGVTTAADPSTAQLSNSEELVEIAVDLVADARLPTERSGDDPTGLETPGDMLEMCMNTLFVEGEQPVTLGGLLHNIVWDGDGEGEADDISTPDAARLAERLTLVYRTRTEYPIGLLEG